MSFPVLDFVGTFVGKKFGQTLKRRKSWNNDVVKYASAFEQSNEIYATPVREWEVIWKFLSESQRNKVIELFDACRGTGRNIYLIDPKDYQSTCTWTQPTYSITAVDQTDDYFTFGGQHASDFQVGWSFKVTGSTGNDGVYTVADISQTDTVTMVYVEEDIPSAVADGSILLMYFQLYKTYYNGEDYEFSEAKKDIQPDQITVKVNSVTKTEGVDYTLTDTEGVIMFDTGSTPTAGQTIEATFSFYYRVRFSGDFIEDDNIYMEIYNLQTIILVERKRRKTEL